MAKSGKTIARRASNIVATASVPQMVVTSGAPIPPATGGKSGATLNARKTDAQKQVFINGLVVVVTILALVFVTRRFNLLSGGK